MFRTIFCSQEELCICEGSQCNLSGLPSSLATSLLLATIIVTIWNG